MILKDMILNQKGCKSNTKYQVRFLFVEFVKGL